MALELGTWPGLEAQVAAIADDIAYDNHDIDDGLRAGLFTSTNCSRCRWSRGTGRRSASAIPASRRETPARAGPRPDRPDGQRRACRDRAPNRESGIEIDRRGARRGPAARRLLGGDGRRGARAQGLPLRAHVRCAQVKAVRERGASGSWPSLAAAYRADPACCPTNGARGESARAAARHRRFHRRDDRSLRHFTAHRTDRPSQSRRRSDF